MPVTAAHRALPLVARPLLPELNVLSGLHAGAVVALESGLCRIGAHEDCDIVLRDPQIRPAHLTVHVHRRFLAIEATGGDVMVGAVRVSQGHGYRCTLPVHMSIGETSLRLAHPAGAETTHQTAITRWAMLAVAGLSIGVACLWWLGPDAAPAAVAASAPPGAAAPRAVAATQPEALAALRDRLDQAGLQPLSIDTRGDTLRVSGLVDSDQRTRWIEVQNWYDRTWGNTPVLRNDVQPAPPLVPPRVHFQAVWLGAQPYVVGERGERLYPGAALADGWVLHRIEHDRLILARQGKEFELTL
ncbi:FHA domain-containing protein [Pseudomonas coleopterorum]|uniref:SctD/MshK family protein n=1 Tax=Pseudomonas coleopterorum TaxID=1605838 RepID=UPI002A6A6291|nr:FHA domain-containing protein [Pseudomonas coleopterorum]MDY1016409.1 FHA domain-containing protein [Pseudomonas coleopterorum]